MVTTGFSFLLLRLTIHRNLRQERKLEPAYTAEGIKHLTSLALYTLAIPLAYVHAPIALLVVAIVTIVWIIPDFAISKSRKK